jgi:hypothetical protein
VGTKAIIVGALIGLSILSAHAQSRGGAGVRAVGVRPSVAIRPAARSGIAVRQHPATVRDTGTSFVNPQFIGNSFFPGGTVQDLFGFPTPGLGFDYVHLAAINGNLGVRALIDPVTRAQIDLALRLRGINSGFVSPFFFGGGFPVVMETPGVAAPQPDVQPQAPIVIVAPPAAQPPPPSTAAAEAPPLPDPGEFVLVQRDGRLLFAVAFTAESGRVVYVTKEGLRRSITLDQLDVDTTLRMNEERGSSIQIPRA